MCSANILFYNSFLLEPPVVAAGTPCPVRLHNHVKRCWPVARGPPDDAVFLQLGEFGLGCRQLGGIQAAEPLRGRRPGGPDVVHRLVLDRREAPSCARYRLELAEDASEGQRCRLNGGEKAPARRRRVGRRRWPGCEPLEQDGINNLVSRQINN